MVFIAKKAPAATTDDLVDLTLWAEDEFESVETALDVKEFTQRNVVPAKPVKGLVEYADGVNWNPGNGEGLYLYTAAGLWVPLGSSTKVGFKATKTSGNQTVVPGSTYYTITFDVENFDDGNHFASSTTWTPPAGRCLFIVNFLFQNLTANTGLVECDVFKNGSSIAAEVRPVGSATTMSCDFSFVDVANGTDAYTFRAWQSSNNTTAVVNGSGFSSVSGMLQ